MELLYSLIGVSVVLVDLSLGDPIDWWFVILTFLCAFVYHIISNEIYQDWLLTSVDSIFITNSFDYFDKQKVGDRGDD